MEITIRKNENEKGKKELWIDDNKVFEIKEIDKLRSGFYVISGTQDTCTLAEKQIEECFAYIQNDLEQYKKGKGDVLLLVKHVPDDVLHWARENISKNSNGECFGEEMRRALIHTGLNEYNAFVTLMIVNQEICNQYKNVKKYIEEAIEKYHQMEQVVFGNWEEKTPYRFTFYFSREYNRTLEIHYEDEQFYIEMEKEKTPVLFHSKEDVFRVISQRLNKIYKKERLSHICEDGISPLFHNAFSNGIGKHKIKIWEKLRSFYSYEEIERECAKFKKEKKKISIKTKDSLWFLQFKNHCVCFNHEGTVYATTSEEELVEWIAQEKKKEWIKTIQQLKDLA